MSDSEEVARFHRTFGLIVDQVEKVIVGYPDVVKRVLLCLFAGGNVLLEGAPGLGKTTLVRVLAQVLELNYARVQFTPDLMPADIIGTQIMSDNHSPQRRLEFRKGPVFTHLLLADEINRASPRTQSALLESMEEHSVSVGGFTHVLEEPYFVLATQNPIEHEGTYPLPAAQLDKFMFKLILGVPDYESMREIFQRTTGPELPKVSQVITRSELLTMRRLVRQVAVADHVAEYAARLTRAVERGNPESSDLANRYVKSCASPRAAQSLLLTGKALALCEGRYHVACEDIRSVFLPALRHRIQLSFTGLSSGVSVEDVLHEILESTPELN